MHSTLQPTQHSTCSTSLPLSPCQGNPLSLSHSLSLHQPSVSFTVPSLSLSLSVFPPEHGGQVLSLHCRCFSGGLRRSLPLAAARLNGTLCPGVKLFHRNTTPLGLLRQLWRMWKPRAAAISLSCKTPERRQSWMSSSSLSIPVGDTGQTYDVQTQIFHCTHQKCTVPSGLQLVQTQVQKVISEVLQAWNCPMNLSLTCSLPLSLYIYTCICVCVCVLCGSQ